MTSITFKDRTFCLADLKAGPETVDTMDLTPYEVGVLGFAHKWYAGQNEFVVHSSGSTGKPKSFTLTRQQMQLSAQATGQAIGLQAGDKALVCLFTHFIAGMMMLVRGFELSLHLTVIEPSGNPLADFPPDAHFDFTAVVPLQLQNVLTKTPEKRPILDKMKGILVGGAPVGAALHQQLQTVAAPIYHTYGMTETVTHIALRRLNGPQANDYFVPFPEIELGLDERGCLTIAAPVTYGEKLVTNDLADLRPDGTFKWLGRADHTINSGGVKVQIETIEQALDRLLFHFDDARLAHRRFFVGPVPDERLGQKVIAMIEGEILSSQMIETIRTELAKSLSRYEIPREFYFAKQFKETPTGKIDRLANLKEIGVGIK